MPEYTAGGLVNCFHAEYLAPCTSIVDSVEDFFLEEGNEMFGATAILPLQQHNMYFYLDCYAQSPQDDGVWDVSAVGFSPIQQ